MRANSVGPVHPGNDKKKDEPEKSRIGSSAGAYSPRSTTARVTAGSMDETGASRPTQGSPPK